MTRMLLVLVALALASGASAQTCTTEWTAASGAWSDDSNWSSGAPEASDTACITRSGTYTVTLDRDQALEGLSLGGASGQQTLSLGGGTLTSLGGGTVGARGRLEVLSSANCASCDGLPLVTGTLTVEGTITHTASTGLLSAGGTLDIAPGGLLRVDTGVNGVNMGQGGTSTLRVRGRVLFSPEANAPRGVTVFGAIDVDGGTLEVTNGTVRFQSEGRFHDATFAAGAEGALSFGLGSGSSGIFIASGTLGGTPEGNVIFTRGELHAASGGATLAFSGTGLQFVPGSGAAFFLASAGGAFTNTGLLRGAGNGLWMRGVSLQNRGTFRMTGTSLRMEEGAEIVSSSELELVDQAGITGGPDGGAVRGSGRIVARLDAQTGGTSRLNVPVDLDGATIEVRTTRFQLSQGTLQDVTLDVPEDRELLFSSSNGGGNSGVFLIRGELRGDVIGTARVSGAEFQAASGGATLNLGGTGLTFASASGTAAVFASAGGEFVNVNRVSVRFNFPLFRQVVFRNRGEMTVTQTSVNINEGGILRNERGGVIDFIDGGSIGAGDGTGRLENAGLITVRRVDSGGEPRTTFSSRLRSLSGGEARVIDGAQMELSPPGGAALPDGARVTGDGTLRISSTQFLIEGEISPGTDAAPIDTLTSSGRLCFSRIAGSARLVIDVDAEGVSDQIVSLGASGEGFPVRPFGTLIVRVRPGYVPALGDTFTILQAATSNQIQGEFTRVVAEGAPSGVAFVAETNDDASAILLRVVEAAPGGNILLSEADPVGGGVRSLFLSGPGVTGVTEARLTCTDCLDSQASGEIPATLSGSDALKEARFDLTSPRAFGYYDLVLTQPGLPDATFPVTVRPYVSWVYPEVPHDNGFRVRPANSAGRTHNFSWHELVNVSNREAGAFPVVFMDRPRPDDTSMILASRFNVARGVFYDSATADDPNASALVIAQVPSGGTTTLEVGLRIDPDAVLFPEQMRQGPEDDRAPFGEGLPLLVTSTSNATFERALEMLGRGLRTTQNAALDAYLASADGANADAVQEALVFTLSSTTYRLSDGSETTLSRIIGELSNTVSAPAGLADAATPAFDAAVRASAQVLQDEVGASIQDALVASGPVSSLFQDELSALGIEIDQSTKRSRDWISDALCEAQGKAGRAYGIDGGGSGGSCTPPNGPVDPNEKMAGNDLPCIYETVTLDGEEVTRCGRSLVPLARAAEPITYTVKFENLPEATAPAEFVTITDVLDPALNPATLEVLGTSSDSTFSVETSGQTVTFRFTDINLPPNVEAPEGEGYVTFRVRPGSPLASGDEVRNQASIVFDFNPPIETGVVIHEARNTTDLATVIEASPEATAGQPYTFRVLATNALGDPVEDAIATIATGTTVLSATPTVGSCTVGSTVVCEFGTLQEDDVVAIDVTLDSPPRGMYTLSSAMSSSAFDAFAANDTDAVRIGLVDVAGEETASGVPTSLTLAKVFPNPSRATATVRFGIPNASPARVAIYDLLGREVALLTNGETLAPGWHEVTWRADVASGVYVIQVATATEAQSRRIVVVQ